MKREWGEHNIGLHIRELEHDYTKHEDVLNILYMSANFLHVSHGSL